MPRYRISSSFQSWYVKEIEADSQEEAEDRWDHSVPGEEYSRKMLDYWEVEELEEG